ncbi:hypothetical protein ACFLWO_00585 [Chloroflexota bacterium]
MAIGNKPGIGASHSRLGCSSANTALGEIVWKETQAQEAGNEKELVIGDRPGIGASYRRLGWL